MSRNEITELLKKSENQFVLIFKEEDLICMSIIEIRELQTKSGLHVKHIFTEKHRRRYRNKLYPVLESIADDLRVNHILISSKATDVTNMKKKGFYSGTL